MSHYFRTGILSGAFLLTALAVLADDVPSTDPNDMYRRYDQIETNMQHWYRQAIESYEDDAECDTPVMAIELIKWTVSDEGMRTGMETPESDPYGLRLVELSPELKTRLRKRAADMIQGIETYIPNKPCPPPAETNNALRTGPGGEGGTQPPILVMRNPDGSFYIPGTTTCFRLDVKGDIGKADCPPGTGEQKTANTQRAGSAVPDPTGRQLQLNQSWGSSGVAPPAGQTATANPPGAPAGGKAGADLLNGQQPVVRGGVDPFAGEWVGRQQEFLDNISRKIADAADRARKEAAAGNHREYLKARNAIELAVDEVKEAPGTDQRIRSMIQDEANQQLAGLDKEFGNKKWPARATDTLQEAVPKSTKKAAGGSTGNKTVKQQAPATGGQGNEAAQQLGNQILQGVIQSGINSAIGRVMGGGGDRRSQGNGGQTMKKPNTLTVKQPTTTSTQPSGGNAPSGPILFQGYTYTPSR